MITFLAWYFAQLNKRYKSDGIKALQEELSELDPAYYEKADIQNPHRLIRAISISRSTGHPYSSFLNKSSEKRSFIPIPLFINMDREQLYDRINRRVIKMMEDGLLDEVKSLYDQR